MNLSARYASVAIQPTAIRTANIVLTSATSRTGSEVCIVDKQNEKMYQATMSMARSMLKRCLITEEDYRQIDTIFTKKYHPTLGTLFADIDLLFLENRANM